MQPLKLRAAGTAQQSLAARPAAIRSKEEALERHINDSLALLPALDARVEARAGFGQPRLVDVGSGAGFPGAILAIARPTWQVWGALTPERPFGLHRPVRRSTCWLCGVCLLMFACSSG
jgi:hypothetical protein